MALLAAAIAALLLVALGQLGRAKSSARTEREVVTAATGIVQSSVTGTGNLEPVTEEDVDFQTSGTLQKVDVSEGEHVHKGQLLASLDSSTAALTLAQAEATLAEARVTLRSDEKTLAKEDDTDAAEESEDVDDDIATTTTTTSPTTSTTSTTQSATTDSDTHTTETTTTDSSASSGTSTSSGSSSSGSSSDTVTASTVDSDKLAVVEDEQTVTTDRTDLTATSLRAPVSGTITSLESITPGDSVSSGTDSDEGSSDSSESDDSSGDDDSSGSSSSTSGSTTSTSSSSSFAVIDTLHQLSMTVSFTEADISKLKVGQTATVTPDALSGVELAGTVTAVSSLGTTSDDVVSYDATITLDQYDSQVKPGMSASAVVIIRQEHGVTVPSEAVSGSGTLATVTEVVHGKDVTKSVIIGLRGSDRDVVVSGLASGTELLETETLPSTGSSSSSSADSTSSSTHASSTLGGSTSGGSTGGGGAPGGSGGPP